MTNTELLLKRIEKQDELIALLKFSHGEQQNFKYYKKYRELESELSALKTMEGEDVSDEPYEPYHGWCDVDKCESEACCGGTGWRDAGYWRLCTEHSRMERNGEKQPKMKDSSVERESRRDNKTGYLTPLKK